MTTTFRSGIYQWRNLVNGKVYIGSTKNFTMRKKTHIEALRKNKHHNRHLQSAWRVVHGKQATHKGWTCLGKSPLGGNK